MAPKFVVGSPPQLEPTVLSRRVKEQEAEAERKLKLKLKQRMKQQQQKDHEPKHRVHTPPAQLALSNPLDMVRRPASDASSSPYLPIPEDRLPLRIPDTHAGVIHSARISQGLADAGANQFSAIYPMSHKARDSLDGIINAYEQDHPSPSQSIELASPRPIPIPHAVLSYDEPEEPSYHGHPEQQVSKHALPEEFDLSDQTRYQFQSDELPEASRRRFLRGGDSVPNMAPLPEQVNLASNPQNVLGGNKKSTNFSRRRIFHHEDSDDGEDGEYNDRSLAPIPRPADVSTGSPHLHRRFNASRRQLNFAKDDVFFPEGRAEPYQTNASPERGPTQKRVQDAFAEELKQCTGPTSTVNRKQWAWEDHKLVDYLARELNQASNHNAEHLSQNTTISYMVKQANDGPQQDQAQLLPALPVHPTTKKKHQLAPIDVAKAEEYLKNSDLGKNVKAVRAPQPSEKFKWRSRKAKHERNDKAEQMHPSVANQNQREVKLEKPRPTSSVYSQDSMPLNSLAKVSPLRINKPKDDIFEDYGRWQEEKKDHRGIPKSLTMPEIDDIRQIEPYTPLTGWLDRDPNVKKGTKIMVRSNGWLENSIIESRKKPEPKKAGFLSAFKKKVHDIKEKADDLISLSVQPADGIYRSLSTRGVTSNNKSSRKAASAVSVPPREQSILYCELMFLLNQATDAFLKKMMNKGYMVVARLKRINDAYMGYGRPRVLGFMYDFSTQLTLVLTHAEHGEFEFYGPRRLERGAILSCLRAALVDARQMQAINYCLNDTIIAKHLIDAYMLLEFFGAEPGHYAVLAKCGIFFKSFIDFETGDYEGRAVHAVYTGGEEAAAPKKEQTEEPDQELNPVQELDPVREGSKPVQEIEPAQLGFGEIEKELPKYPYPLYKRQEQTEDWLKSPAASEEVAAAAAASDRAEDEAFGYRRQPVIADYDQSRFSGQILQPRTYTLPKNGLSPWHPVNQL